MRVRLRPTRLGLAFLGLVLLTLVGCINYALSLGYGLTFLLGGLWIITAAQVLRAARLLSGVVVAPAQARAGEDVTYAVQVQQLGPSGNVRVQGQAMQAGAARNVVTSGVVLPEAPTTLSLTVPAAQRGPLHLRNLNLLAVDTFGLWHAAIDLPEPPEVLVVPAPEEGAPPPPTMTAAGTGGTGKRVAGQDEFAGVRAYQGGDSPRLISWKHVARTGTLLTREFDAPAGVALALNWADTAPAGDVEARLSRLSAWIEVARAGGRPFTLTLPETALPLGSGEAHTRLALDTLARQHPLPLPAARAQEGRGGFLALPSWLQTANPPRFLSAPALQYTLLVLAFTLLPGFLQWPWWTNTLLLGVLAYCFMQARQPERWPVLPSLVLLLGVVLAGTGLVSTFGTLLGQQAGTAILAVLIVLKAAETRTVRDAKLLSLLGLFLLVTHFFHSQGPLMALHVLLASALLLSALARWVNPDTWKWPLRNQGAARQAGRLMLLAAPVAALLFAFFPRPDGPLWRLPIQGGAQTGLSDEIQAGEFSELAKNNSVAFRADFRGRNLPPAQERYWRGPVYELYDGMKWTQARALASRFGSPSLEVLPAKAVYEYALTLEPNDKFWMLGLETVTGVPENTLITSAFQAFTPRTVSSRSRFNLRSQAALTGRREDQARLQLNLYLPENQSPRALALGRSWLQLPPQERVKKAQAFLLAGGFTYTLNPPRLPEQNRVDAFLFSSKQGFCEHYASAFAFLMRAAGVPARVVAGYQGGEVNPDGDYLIVRQADAHAWTEVWLAGQGWVRVDPTALIAPARVNTNLSTALRSPEASTAAPRNAWQTLLLRADTFQNNWNNWVAGYSGEQQRGVLGRLGIREVGGAPYLLALGVLAGLALLPALLAVRRAVRPSDPALAALHDLSEKLRLSRFPGETASAYAERAAQQYPTLQGPLSRAAQLFNTARYAPPNEQQTHLAELRLEVRQLRLPRPERQSRPEHQSRS